MKVEVRVNEDLRMELENALREKEALKSTLLAQEAEIARLRNRVLELETLTSIGATQKPNQLAWPIPSPTRPGKRAGSPLPTPSSPSLDFAPTGKSCTRCFLTSTPTWRLHPHTGEILCNACGLYLSRLANPLPEDDARILDDDDDNDGAPNEEEYGDGDDDEAPYPFARVPSHPLPLPVSVPEDAFVLRAKPGERTCTGCKTRSTPRWRSAPATGENLCNACYLRRHRKPRHRVASGGALATSSTRAGVSTNRSEAEADDKPSAAAFKPMQTTLRHLLWASQQPEASGSGSVSVSASARPFPSHHGPESMDVDAESNSISDPSDEDYIPFGKDPKAVGGAPTSTRRPKTKAKPAPLPLPKIVSVATEAFLQTRGAIPAPLPVTRVSKRNIPDASRSPTAAEASTSDGIGENEERREAL
ncbi:hypothetical protein HMN09_00475300 [Mycena chlorophos]|uniref:GATA-type domain-containing protein n=1 Tax=Mycena chlorophos TaxID=658473 RepID=A0A8H6TEK8_MYCCL|nr:hypothetical protein HMN09_00475300 [Mycena chlorophos]